MKKEITAALLVIGMSANPTLADGVTGISKNGSVYGNTAYKIQCANGKEWRIWRSSGQWWDGRGIQGGQSRDLNERVRFLCG